MTLEELAIELATAYMDRMTAANQATPNDLAHLRQALGGLVPFQMGYPDKAACARQARLSLVSYLLARPIETTNDLSRGEAWRITAWLRGQNPYTFEPASDQLAATQARQTEVAEWLTQKEHRIKSLTATRTGRKSQQKKNGGPWFKRSSPSTA